MTIMGRMPGMADSSGLCKADEVSIPLKNESSLLASITRGESMTKGQTTGEQVKWTRMKIWVANGEVHALWGGK